MLSLPMEDAGAAAVVLHSVFEEQLRLEEYELHHHLSYGVEYFPGDALADALDCYFRRSH